MAITIDDFKKVWASQSPLTPYSFSESQYKEGWNFIGSTPPARQMWDFLQKQNDEKFEYLLNNFDDYAKKTDLDDYTKKTDFDDYAKKTDLDDYLPLAGGTLTGDVLGVTPPNGDNSTKIATTAFVNAKAAKYLPLRGGTMSGWLSANENEFRILNSKAGHDGAVSVFGGDGATTGANLYLYGTSHSSQAGRFVLSATDGANKTSLLGQADGTLTWNSQPLLPVGIVQAFAGTTIPSGWLLCDGSAVSRTTYANLYACIGTTYGAGDGSTTFNLPNLIDKFVEGSATAGTVKSAGLPNITGSVTVRQYVLTGNNFNGGALKGVAGNDDTNASYVCETNNDERGHGFIYLDASQCNSIYGKSTTVQPPALTMRYIIKY